MTTNIFKSVNPDEIIIWSSLARHVDDAIYMMDDGYHLPKVVLQQSIYVILLVPDYVQVNYLLVMGLGLSPAQCPVFGEGPKLEQAWYLEYPKLLLKTFSTTTMDTLLVHNIWQRARNFLLF